MRRSLGMLSLRDAIAGSDIMQHEITKGMDDFVAESQWHRAQVAAGRRLAIAVECLNRRSRWGCGMVGVVTNGAAERLVIPEEFFAFLCVLRVGEREVSGRRLAGPQEAREGLHVINERVDSIVRILRIKI